MPKRRAQQLLSRNNSYLDPPTNSYRPTRSSSSRSQRLKKKKDPSFLLQILGLCHHVGVLSGNDLLFMSCLSKKMVTHKIIRSIKLPSEFLKRHAMTEESKLNPWVNPESYAADVISSLFPPNRFPMLQRLDVVPCFYDAVAINMSCEIGGAVDANPFDLSPHPKVAGSCQPRRDYANIEVRTFEGMRMGKKAKQRTQHWTQH
jgi:hypothetical protein